jgi:hypothetical protein
MAAVVVAATYRQLQRTYLTLVSANGLDVSSIVSSCWQSSTCFRVACSFTSVARDMLYRMERTPLRTAENYSTS